MTTGTQLAQAERESATCEGLVIGTILGIGITALIATCMYLHSVESGDTNA